jgi:hypothetical protein
MTGRQHRSLAACVVRAGAWLAWWVLLMAIWVVVDGAIGRDELLAGAGAAALGAFFAETASHQAGARFRMRVRWLVPALMLPGQVVHDMALLFGALWRQLVDGTEPPSGFRAEAVRYGAQGARGKTRRVLLLGGRSVPPNTFALGIDAESGVMVVHQLVLTESGEVECSDS